MRVWVMLTQGMKVYVYKEGHLKTCSEKYDINNQKDAFIHITNYSFQKHCLNFQKFELGNEVPFYDFQKFLDKEFKDKKIDVKKHIMEQVKYIVGLTMKSVKEKINVNNRNFCFEIFGYDFMIDINFNVYLLEINTNPGLEISSPWIKAIVPRMVDDALRLTIDEVFPPKYQFDKNSITELNYEEYSNDLIHNKKEEEKKEEEKKEGPRLVKRKRYTTICDQGSGTQDQGEEQYKQENIRQREVKIQKKINETKIEDIKNNENSAKKIQNGNEDIKDILLEKNNEEIINNINNCENDNKPKEKEEKEKPFNQKDYKSPYPVPGYEPWENLWELICELNEEKPQNNNYLAGVRGLLEIQKKRQTSSAPTSNEINNIKKVVKNNINNNNAQKDKNVANSNKNVNNIKDNKKEKKIEDKKIINKKNSENLVKKDKNMKENNLNKNKEKEKEKKIKENINKKPKKIEEERKNKEINKDIYEKEDKKIIQINTNKEENKEISEKENNEIEENLEKLNSNEQNV